jgi:hypothetical protein
MAPEHHEDGGGCSALFTKKKMHAHWIFILTLETTSSKLLPIVFFPTAPRIRACSREEVAPAKKSLPVLS